MQEESIISKIFSTEIPKDLYHYTSSSGLMGILETNKIWTTKIQYLNDNSELYLAFDYIREEIEFQKNNANNRTRSIEDLERMSETLHSIEKINISVASFTEEGDQLSQWRGYCKIGDGYSLGFDGKKLNEVIDKFSGYLLPCVYDTKIHRLMIKELIKYSPFVVDNSDTAPVASPLCRFTFDTAALFIAPMIKEEGFSEEKEWRLVCGPFDFRMAMYRRGNFSLIPYWAVDLHLEETLKTIVIGPTPEQELSQLAVHGYLTKTLPNPHTYLGIIYSEIPYRSV